MRISIFLKKAAADRPYGPVGGSFLKISVQSVDFKIFFYF